MFDLIDGGLADESLTSHSSQIMNHLESNLIVFAGAGASCGVSKEKYPTAIAFRDRLPDAVTKDSLFQRLSDYLTRQRGTGSIDIEHILWELGRLVTVLEEMVAHDTFSGELLRTNQISVITGHQQQGQTTSEQFKQLLNLAIDLQNKINQNVYDFYSTQPTNADLDNSWIPLLEWASNARFSRVDLVTTNYDLVIEGALRRVSSLKVDNGFNDDLYPGIDLSRWEDGGPKSVGLLTKLHGSVDWKLGIGGTIDHPVIRRGHPEFDGDHKKRLILYPGFKGRPDRQPFISFHEYFRHRLASATHLLFIGFAFRDEFINELVATTTSPTVKIAVLDPAKTLPTTPSFLTRAVHLRQAFGKPKSLKTLLTDDGFESFNMKDIIDWAGL